jgi:hypothetical protein
MLTDPDRLSDKLNRVEQKLDAIIEFFHIGHTPRVVNLKGAEKRAMEDAVALRKKLSIIRDGSETVTKR